MNQRGSYQQIASNPLIVIGVGIIAATAYFVEDLIMVDRPPMVHYINYLSTGVTIIGLLLYLIKKLDNWKTLSVYAFIFGLNLLLVPYFDAQIPEFGQFYVRNLFFSIVFIQTVALIWGLRVMMVSIFVLFAQLISITFVNKVPFLIDSFAAITAVLIVFAIIQYSLISSLELYLNSQEELIQRLNESNATKMKLLSIVSHDLRTPLMAIANLSFFMDEEIQKTDNEELKEYGDMLTQTTESTTRLLNNLIEWSRSQAESFEISKEMVDLLTEVNKIKKLYDTNLSRKHIKLEAGPFEVDKIIADPNALDVILRNLISNAIKFSKDEGVISISSYNGGETHKVVIEDNGVGMDSQTLDKLFDLAKFDSQHGTASEKGSGIGFNLCIELMKLHKGQIEVESEPGKGTKITLMFPDN